MVTLAVPHPRTYLTNLDSIAGSPHLLTLAQPGAVDDFAVHDFAAIDAFYALWSLSAATS